MESIGSVKDQDIDYLLWTMFSFVRKVSTSIIGLNPVDLFWNICNNWLYVHEIMKIIASIKNGDMVWILFSFPEIFTTNIFLINVFSLITWNTKPWIEKLEQSTLRKPLPTISTLVEELSNSSDYFLRLSGFPDLFSKQFLSDLNSPNLIFQLLLCKSNVNKTV